MFEMTDDAGNLRIPSWPYGEDPEPKRACYVLKMNWTREDAEILVREHKELENALRLMAGQAASGPWPANRARCEGCAYARGCVFRGE